MTDSKRIDELEQKLTAAMQTISAMQAHTRRVDVARVALARNGVNDPGAADLLAAQIGQTDNGRWVAFTEDGVPRVGDDADLTMGLDALVREYKAQTGATATETTAAPAGVILDPKHPQFNYTAASLAARSDPAALAKLMENIR